VTQQRPLETCNHQIKSIFSSIILSAMIVSCTGIRMKNAMRKNPQAHLPIRRSI
jgi:hypothetical protein